MAKEPPILDPGERRRHGTIVGRSLKCASTDRQRKVQVSVLVRAGRTTIDVGEWLHDRLASLHGGIIGGGGGGSLGAIVAFAQGGQRAPLPMFRGILLAAGTAFSPTPWSSTGESGSSVGHGDLPSARAFILLVPFYSVLRMLQFDMGFAAVGVARSIRLAKPHGRVRVVRCRDDGRRTRPYESQTRRRFATQWITPCTTAAHPPRRW